MGGPALFEALSVLGRSGEYAMVALAGVRLHAMGPSESDYSEDVVTGGSQLCN